VTRIWVRQSCARRKAATLDDKAKHSDYSKHRSIRARQARERGDVETLLSLLGSTDRLDRISAVANLGQTKDPRAVAALHRCLQAKDENLRIGALKALEDIGDRSAVAHVFEAASADTSFGVRVTAMSTLGAFGDPRAVGLIGEALRRSDNRWPRWYRKWAAKKLVELGDVTAVADLEEAAKRGDLLGRWRLRRAARALKTMGS
jgi:HEAT repeat protein